MSLYPKYKPSIQGLSQTRDAFKEEVQTGTLYNNQTGDTSNGNATVWCFTTIKPELTVT